MHLRFFIFLFIVFLFLPFLTYAEPVLLFSDMESAPSSGWSSTNPERGAAVTIWGYGFGNSRGTSYVTVDGVDLTSNNDYTTWGDYSPTPYWQKITFWLNDNMQNGDTQITVTVNGKTSNALDFTIRDGRILFVDYNVANGYGSLTNPYNDLQASSFVTGMQPGDIYYFREGIYDRKMNGGNSALWIRSSEPSGTSTHPISFIAYPGEVPTVYIESYNVNFNNGFKMSNNYTVISGFKFDSEYQGVSLSNYHRFVGNDLIGLKNLYASGTGIVVTQGDGNKVLGNAIHGGNSKNRLDHATYFSGCSPIVGNHLGWNYIYNNDFGRGPELSINHQENRCEPNTEILKSHYVFNNIVDCSPQRAVGLYIYDLSYDTGEAQPDPTYVYNNMFLNCGTLDLVNQDNVGWAPALIGNTHAHFYNNLLYNAQYTGYESGGVIASDFINNIIVMNSSDPLDGRDHRYIRDNSGGVAQIRDNLFFDIGSGTASSLDIDEGQNIVGENPLFTNPSEGDFTPLQGSPVIDIGTSITIDPLHYPPEYAPINRDISYMLRQGGVDLGPIEAFQDNSGGTYDLSDLIIFEDNFDAQPDYTSSSPLYLYGWNHRRSGEDIWSPTTGFPNHHDPFEILSSNSDKSKGETGKSFVAWRESYDMGWDNWNSDGILSFELDTGVDEVCTRFWIKFSPDVTQGGAGKFFRFASYDGEGAFYRGFTSGNNAPQYLWTQTLGGKYGLRNYAALRADPQETNYYMTNPAPINLPRPIDDGDMTLNYYSNIRDLDGDGSYENPVIPTFTHRQTGELITSKNNASVAGVFGTEWNQMDFCVKMNSGPGTMDGIARQWIRNQLTFQNTQLPFQGTDSPGDRKWNVISYGGNDIFKTYPNEDKHEEWYAFDDIVIYKPLNSSSPLWDESPQDGRLPLDYVVGSATGEEKTFLRPENLSITFQNATAVNFTWDIPTNHNFTRFEIMKNGKEIDSLEGDNIYYISTSQNWYRDTKLDASTTYGFKILGEDSSGNMYHSEVLIVEPYSSSSAPSAPESLDATGVGKTKVNLSWSTSTDDNLVGYRIYRDSYLVSTVTGTSFQDSGLSPDTNYSYYVEAYDDEGLTASSLIITITTKSDYVIKSVYNQILFEDNFDSHDDWTSDNFKEDGTLLENWTFLRADDLWSPYTGYQNNHPVAEVLSTNFDKARGSSGKSYVSWRESYDPGWKKFNSDSILVKHLEEDYNELFVEFWVTYSDEMIDTFYTGGLGSSKIFRFYNYNGVYEDRFEFFGETNSPKFLWDVTGGPTYGVRNAMSFYARGPNHNDGEILDLPHQLVNEGDMHASYKTELGGMREDGSDAKLPNKVDGGFITDQIEPAYLDHVFGPEEEWTKMTFYIKMNSAPGVQDGVIMQWVDNQRIFYNENVDWVREGWDLVGWNSVAISGNDFFKEYDNSLRYEEWLAIDDVVIYTPLNSSSSMWDESPQDGRLPYDYVVGSPLEESPQDIVAPTLLSWSPVNQKYNSDTHNVNLSVETNELSTCGFSTNNVNFADMTDFSLTGSTQHIHELIGLNDNQHYEYYIRCIDEALNENETILKLNFTIGSSDNGDNSEDTENYDGNDNSGSSRGGSDVDSSSESALKNKELETETKSPYKEQTCIPKYVYSQWSSCVNGKQFREVTDSNSCKSLKIENRVCQIGLDENEIKFINARELKIDKINHRRYTTELLSSYNEMIYTSSKLDDDKFVLVDNKTQDQYLGRLVEEEPGKYYYSIERIDEKNLQSLKEEGLAQRTLFESVGSAFKNFRESRNFISILVIFSLFGITTIIYFITRYIKRIHRISSFEK